MWHIIERNFGVHLAWAFVFWAGAFFGLTYWMSHHRKVRAWLEDPVRVRMVIAALAVSTILPLREPYDVYWQTQSIWKTPFDQVGWIMFSFGVTWVGYRIWKWYKTRKEEK